jgi:hypothetical protein
LGALKARWGLGAGGGDEAQPGEPVGRRLREEPETFEPGGPRAEGLDEGSAEAGLARGLGHHDGAQEPGGAPGLEAGGGDDGAFVLGREGGPGELVGEPTQREACVAQQPLEGRQVSGGRGSQAPGRM